MYLGLLESCPVIHLYDMVTRDSILKYERAREHIVAVNSAVDRFLKSNPYRLERDEHGEPGKLQFWITLLEEPPTQTSLAAGDAIHNMRSALDHIVFEISSRYEANPRGNGLPSSCEGSRVGSEKEGRFA